jgi:hypothetical protein
MRNFLLGVVFALLALAASIYVVSRFGWYPIGADNPPGRLEQTLASRAMDVYADKHKPEGGNPIAPTDGNLIGGARAYEKNCASCHEGASAKISPLRDKFSPPVPQSPAVEAAWRTSAP